jgi:hypothetical protein
LGFFLKKKKEKEKENEKGSAKTKKTRGSESGRTAATSPLLTTPPS